MLATLIIYAVVVSIVGLLNSRSRNSEDYFLASRSLPSWLLAITFIASWWGGGSAIDLVDVAHKDGLSTFWIYGVPVLLSTFLMYLFAAGIRRIGTISQPQIMEQRYGKGSALMLSMFILIFMTIAATTQIIVIARFLQAFLDMSYVWSALLGTSLVLFYSMFGGFRGVVLTDLLQFVFFLISTLFIFGFVYHHSGGIDALTTNVETLGKEGYMDINYNLGDKMAYIITFGTSWMVQANIWQRISAARTPKSAKRMMLISFFVFIPLYLIVSLTGMFSSLLYDEIPTGGIVPNIVLGLENPILQGVIFIGLCSAIMSTMDSMFNTGSLTLTLDIYKKYLQPDKSDRHYIHAARISTVLIAGISFLLATRIQSVLTISWIGADFIATGAFIPLVLAFIWKKASAKAAMASMIFGLMFSSYNLLVALGVNLPVAWEIASAEQAMVGILSSLCIFVIVSLCTKGNKAQAEEFIKHTRS